MKNIAEMFSYMSETTKKYKKTYGSRDHPMNARRILRRTFRFDSLSYRLCTCMLRSYPGTLKYDTPVLGDTLEMLY